MQAITLAAPPQARQVFTSMSPKAPTFGEYPLEPLRPAQPFPQIKTVARGLPVMRL